MSNNGNNNNNHHHSGGGNHRNNRNNNHNNNHHNNAMLQQQQHNPHNNNNSNNGSGVYLPPPQQQQQQQHLPQGGQVYGGPPTPHAPSPGPQQVHHHHHHHHLHHQLHHSSTGNSPHNSSNPNINGGSGGGGYPQQQQQQQQPPPPSVPSPHPQQQQQQPPMMHAHHHHHHLHHHHHHQHHQHSNNNNMSGYGGPPPPQQLQQQPPPSPYAPPPSPYAPPPAANQSHYPPYQHNPADPLSSSNNSLGGGGGGYAPQQYGGVPPLRPPSPHVQQQQQPSSYPSSGPSSPYPPVPSYAPSGPLSAPFNTSPGAYSSPSSSAATQPRSGSSSAYAPPPPAPQYSSPLPEGMHSSHSQQQHPPPHPHHASAGPYSQQLQQPPQHSRSSTNHARGGGGAPPMPSSQPGTPYAPHSPHHQQQQQQQASYQQHNNNNQAGGYPPPHHNAPPPVGPPYHPQQQYSSPPVQQQQGGAVYGDPNAALPPPPAAMSTTAGGNAMGPPPPSSSGYGSGMPPAPPPQRNSAQPQPYPSSHATPQPPHSQQQQYASNANPPQPSNNVQPPALHHHHHHHQHHLQAQQQLYPPPPSASSSGPPSRSAFGSEDPTAMGGGGPSLHQPPPHHHNSHGHGMPNRGGGQGNNNNNVPPSLTATYPPPSASTNNFNPYPHLQQPAPPPQQQQQQQHLPPNAGGHLSSSQPASNNIMGPPPHHHHLHHHHHHHHGLMQGGGYPLALPPVTSSPNPPPPQQQQQQQYPPPPLNGTTLPPPPGGMLHNQHHLQHHLHHHHQQQQQQGLPLPQVQQQQYPAAAAAAAGTRGVGGAQPQPHLFPQSTQHRAPRPAATVSPQPQPQPSPQPSSDRPLVSPAAQRLLDAGYPDDDLIALLDRHELLETIGLADYLAEVRERRKREALQRATRRGGASNKQRRSATSTVSGEQLPTADAFASDDSNDGGDGGGGAEDAFGSTHEDDTEEPSSLHATTNNPLFAAFLQQEAVNDTMTIAIDLHYLLSRLVHRLHQEDPLWFVRSPVPHRLLALVKEEVTKLRDFELEPLFVMQGLWPVGDVEAYRIPDDVLQQRSLVWQALATQRYPPTCLQQLELDQVFDTQSLPLEADRAVAQYIQNELGATVVVAPYLNWAQMSLLRGEGAVQLLYAPAAALMVQDERLELVLDLNLDDQMSGGMIVVRRDRVLRALFPNIMRVGGNANNNSAERNASTTPPPPPPAPAAEAEADDAELFHARSRAGDRLLDLCLLGTTYPAVQLLHTSMHASIFDLHQHLSVDPQHRTYNSLKDMIAALYTEGQRNPAGVKSTWLRHARSRCYVRHNVVLSFRNAEMPVGYHSRCLFRCYHPEAAAEAQSAAQTTQTVNSKHAPMTSHHPYGAPASAAMAATTTAPSTPPPIHPPLVSQLMLGVFGNMLPLSLLLMQFCGVLSVGCITALVHSFVADVGPPCDSDDYREAMSMVMTMWSQVLYQLVRDTSACTPNPNVVQHAHEMFMSVDDEGRTLSTSSTASAAGSGGYSANPNSNHVVTIVAPGEAALPSHSSSRAGHGSASTSFDRLNEISWIRWFEPFQQPMLKPGDLIVLDDWNVAGRIDPSLHHVRQMQLHHVLALHNCAVTPKRGTSKSNDDHPRSSDAILEAYSVILLRSFDLLGYFTHVASSLQSAGGAGAPGDMPPAGSGLGNFVQHVLNVAKADPIHSYSYILLVELFRTDSLAKPPLRYIPPSTAHEGSDLDPLLLASRIACAMSLRPTTEGPDSIPEKRWLPIYQRPLGSFVTIAAMTQRALRELVEVSTATYYLRKRNAQREKKGPTSADAVDTSDVLSLLPHLPFGEPPNAHGAMMLFYAVQLMEVAVLQTPSGPGEYNRRRHLQAMARSPTRSACMAQLHKEFLCLFTDVSGALLETVTFVLYGIYLLRGCLQCEDDFPVQDTGSQLRDELASLSFELVVDAWTFYFGGEEVVAAAPPVHNNNNKKGSRGPQQQTSGFSSTSSPKKVSPNAALHGSVVDAISLSESLLLNR